MIYAVLKPLSNSGATPVKDEADDPVQCFSVEAPNKSMGVKSVEVGKQTSFLWKKAQYVYVETADIEGAAVQNISNLAANKVLPKDLMAVLSSIEQGVNCGLVTFIDCVHLSSYKYCCQHFLLRLSHVGLHYSKLAHSALKFINSSSFDIDKMGADANQLLNAAYTGGVTSSIGCETVAFLIHCMEPKWVIPNGLTLSWIANTCKQLAIDTHEAKNPKDMSFEDVVHLLLFLSFCCLEDDDVLLKSCPSFLKMRFLCELVVLRLHFQRGDSKSFWDVWKFPPTPTSDYALCFEKLNLPPYYAKPTAKRVGAKIKLSTQAEQPRPPADVEETALVTAPAPASKKRGVMALHSGQSVRSKATSRSQKEATKDDK
ncbi:hypothetical protein HDU78_011836 [Chytriomyces hyalinus]|nr:hypothetical protein HDU78_011836 [Chytriomyces hyalinus]